MVTVRETSFIYQRSCYGKNHPLKNHTKLKSCRRLFLLAFKNKTCSKVTAVFTSAKFDKLFKDAAIVGQFVSAIVQNSDNFGRICFPTRELHGDGDHSFPAVTAVTPR